MRLHTPASSRLGTCFATKERIDGRDHVPIVWTTSSISTAQAAAYHLSHIDDPAVAGCWLALLCLSQSGAPSQLGMKRQRYRAGRSMKRRADPRRRPRVNRIAVRHAAVLFGPSLVAACNATATCACRRRRKDPVDEPVGRPAGANDWRIVRLAGRHGGYGKDGGKGCNQPVGILPYCNPEISPVAYGPEPPIHFSWPSSAGFIRHRT